MPKPYQLIRPMQRIASYSELDKAIEAAYFYLDEFQKVEHVFIRQGKHTLGRVVRYRFIPKGEK